MAYKILDTGATILIMNEDTKVADLIKENIHNVQVDPTNNKFVIITADNQNKTETIKIDYTLVATPAVSSGSDLRYLILNMMQSTEIALGDEPKLVDAASATLTYIGYASPGVQSADPSWAIKRVQVTGNVTEIAWATGYRNRTNVWNNRASLTYVI